MGVGMTVRTSGMGGLDMYLSYLSTTSRVLALF